MKRIFFAIMFAFTFICLYADNVFVYKNDYNSKYTWFVIHNGYVTTFSIPVFNEEAILERPISIEDTWCKLEKGNDCYTSYYSQNAYNWYSRDFKEYKSIGKNFTENRTFVKSYQVNLTFDMLKWSTHPDYINGRDGSSSFVYHDDMNIRNTQNTNTKSTNQSKRWKNVRRTYDCDRCHHSGKCQTCNGKGWYQGTYGPIDCPNCDGYKTGRCSKCHGSGTIEKMEQVYE